MFFPFDVFSSQRFLLTFCPCRRFLQWTLFPIDVFYFPTFFYIGSFFQSTFLFFNVLPVSMFFTFDLFFPVGVFSTRPLVPFGVFSFDVLSTNILYRWRFLLRRFVGESPFLPLKGCLLAKHERRCVQKNKKLAYKLS